MREWTNIFVRKLVRLLLHIFYIFPIKKNRVMFESYGGISYSCNPKYLCEYINRYYSGKFELIWVFKDPKKYENIEYIRGVKLHSFKFFIYRFTSKFIVCNKTDEVYLPKRKKQVVINTWHAGGAYKRVGLSYEKTYSKATEWQDYIVREETSIYISSSKAFTKYNIKEAYKYEGEILNSGMPRNDVYFDAAYVKQLRKKIDSIYNTQNKIIVLYAPTFRGDYENNEKITFSLPVDQMIFILERKYNKPVIILNRSHYNDKNALNIKSKYIDKLINVNDFDDMQELLAAADILVTDYSSSMWDFALLSRPCFLYIPDVQEYCDDRGTYTPINSWPGIICKSEKELIDRLETIVESEVIEKARKHLHDLGSFENGTASKTIVNRMISIMNEE
nr:CDP-glycerol glycerophosphotransferase family protein [uncultured Blautia sp.]